MVPHEDPRLVRVLLARLDPFLQDRELVGPELADEAGVVADELGRVRVARRVEEDRADLQWRAGLVRRSVAQVQVLDDEGAVGATRVDVPRDVPENPGGRELRRRSVSG